MLILFHAIHILLWGILVTIILMSRNMSDFISKRMAPIGTMSRWIFVPFCRLLSGGGMYVVLRLIFFYMHQYQGLEPSSLFALILVYIFPSYIFALVGVSVAPSHKILINALLTILLFAIMSTGILFTDWHLMRNEHYFYYWYYSLAGVLSIIVGLIVHLKVVRNWHEN